MSRPHALPKLAAAGALALALALGGCISLLPKSDPAQLYRFGATAPAAQPMRADAVGVFDAGGQFQREAAGDRILTVTGDRVAYIADARWIAPAEVLFGEAVASAFESSGGKARLVARGEPARSDYVLRLDVRNFETDYGAGGAPTVRVRVRAVLTAGQGRPPAEQIFEVRVPAAENRVSAIVAAYDQALAKVLDQVVSWTSGQVA